MTQARVMYKTSESLLSFTRTASCEHELSALFCPYFPAGEKSQLSLSIRYILESLFSIHTSCPKVEDVQLEVSISAFVIHAFFGKNQ